MSTKIDHSVFSIPTTHPDQRNRPAAFVTYSIVIPLYNEKESLEPLWNELAETLDTLPGKAEVIFINDGSTDGSVDVLQRLRHAPLEKRMLGFGRNRGKAAALQTGFLTARGDIIITLDADLQDDPREIPKLLDALHAGFDLVSGLKADRHDPISKTVPSFFFNGLIRRLSGLPLRDINSGFKVYRRTVIEKIVVYGELYRFIPILAANEGFLVTEVPVNHRARRFGKSKYGATRFIRGFLDLMTVTFLTRFVRRPLHFFGAIGLITLITGFAICLWLSVDHFVLHQSIGDRPLLLFGILFVLAGLQILFTGLLAELITYNSQVSNHRHIIERDTGHVPPS